MESPACLQHDGGDFDSLSELATLGFTVDKWSFICKEWVLISPLSGKKWSFPLTAAATHGIFKELNDTVVLPSLNERWEVSFTLRPTMDC
ncbi:hypothetical protein R1flu_002514 [Riccia fluitans]|uniref:Uncharacterized protein n=1 Tax=Riccia fluitans TaxID=41844 RepID=A0ABD1YA61_9MARC